MSRQGRRPESRRKRRRRSAAKSEKKSSNKSAREKKKSARRKYNSASRPRPLRTISPTNSKTSLRISKPLTYTSPDYSDEQGNIKYPVADELLKKYPYVSIRGQKGTLCKRPEPSDLGFVLPMTFQLWINLSNFLEYMQLESFSLEAFHESLAFETEDDVPLLSEIIKVLLVRIVEWMQ